jgi:hypothetical protein
MAPSSPPSSLATTLSTTLHLISQFSAALSTPPSELQPGTAQNPLALLTASSAALKQNVTRLSLLTLTPPFTPTAVGPLLNALNTSILPSLVTASHLITPAAYTTAFSAEAASLTKQCLSDLKGLLELTGSRGRSPIKTVSGIEKNALTQATGQIWARCDSLAAFAEGGLSGFMTQRVGQWLALMRDAVAELEDWDPEEEVGDDPFGLDPFDGNNEKDETPKTDDSGETGNRAILQAGVKTEVLKVLTRIPQSVHVVIKQRLGPAHLPPSEQLSPTQRLTLDAIVSQTRKISEAIDESAEAMYMGDLERCLKLAGEARSLAIGVVENVRDPWIPAGSESKEDVYILRALEWIRRVKPIPGEDKSMDGARVAGITEAIEGVNIR